MKLVSSSDLHVEWTFFTTLRTSEYARSETSSFKGLSPGNRIAMNANVDMNEFASIDL